MGCCSTACGTFVRCSQRCLTGQGEGAARLCEKIGNFEKFLLLFVLNCAIIIKLSMRHAPLAQLDRASGYGPEGRGFESLTACQKDPKP